MWSRILATMYSYEYNKGPILAIGGGTDWFFRLDVFETVYSGEVLHLKSAKTGIFTLALQ